MRSADPGILCRDVGSAELAFCCNPSRPPLSCRTSPPRGGDFDATVEQAIGQGWSRHGAGYGTTHLKAMPIKSLYELGVIDKSRADYWDALDGAIEEDREAHGKKSVAGQGAPADREGDKGLATDPEPR